MKKLFARFLRRLVKTLGEEQEITLQPDSQQEIKQDSSPKIEEEILVPAAKKSYRTVPKKKESSRRKKK